MFYLIFGGLWTGFTALMAFIFLGTDDGITINDVYIEDPTFSDLIPLYIFFAIFFAVGFFMLYKGLKVVFNNIQTKRLGVERYAIITDIRETGSYVNGRPELKAIMCVADDEYGGVNIYEESIGFKDCEYKIGDFLIVQQYKTDVNIIQSISESTVPFDKADLLRQESRIAPKDTFDSHSRYGSPSEVSNIEEEVIIINGKKYVQKK